MNLPTNSFEVIHGTQNRNRGLDQQGDWSDSLPRKEWVERLFLCDGRNSGREGQVERQLSTSTRAVSETRQGDRREVPPPCSLSPTEILAFRRKDKELRGLVRRSFSRRMSDFKHGILKAFAGEHESLAFIFLVHGSICIFALYICLWAVRIITFVFGGGMQ